eukprot:1695032-Pleurochrysis_carterae.AAC.1
MPFRPKSVLLNTRCPTPAFRHWESIAHSICVRHRAYHAGWAGWNVAFVSWFLFRFTDSIADTIPQPRTPG